MSSSLFTETRCGLGMRMVLAAAAPILALLSGCQQPRDAKPFWVCTKPAPALHELEDVNVARSAGITQPKPKQRVAPRPRVVPVPEPKVLVRSLTLGRSVGGTPIDLHIFGTSPRPTLIFGGIHGNEPSATALTRKFLAYLQADPSVLGGRSVAIIPLVNPDGLRARTRGNSRRVDCNRNFPARNWAKSRPTSRNYGGILPASEPETRAVIDAVAMLNPRQIISVHSISNGRFCNNFDGPGKGLAEAMAAHNRYPVKASIGYPTPGSFGTWAGIERSIPTVTLELPAEKPGEKAWWAVNRRALLAAIEHGAPGSPILTGR